MATRRYTNAHGDKSVERTGVTPGGRKYYAHKGIGRGPSGHTYPNKLTQVSEGSGKKRITDVKSNGKKTRYYGEEFQKGHSISKGTTKPISKGPTKPVKKR